MIIWLIVAAIAVAITALAITEIRRESAQRPSSSWSHRAKVEAAIFGGAALLGWSALMTSIVAFFVWGGHIGSREGESWDHFMARTTLLEHLQMYPLAAAAVIGIVAIFLPRKELPLAAKLAAIAPLPLAGAWLLFVIFVMMRMSSR